MPAGVLLPDGRWHLSLSHSDGWVGVAVSDKPVGFDLQCRRPLPPHRLRRITERFHPTEAAALCALSPAAQADEFWRWWVLKESVLKLTGEGLTRPLASFCIRKEREAYATQIADKPVCLRTYVMPGDGPVMAAAIYGEQQGK